MNAMTGAGRVPAAGGRTESGVRVARPTSPSRCLHTAPLLAALLASFFTASPAVAQSMASQVQLGTTPAVPSGRAKLRFEIVVPASARKEATTGRAFVILARSDSVEPRLQISRVGTPMFGRDFERLPPGGSVTVDGTDLGHPVWDMADIPAGEYTVQAVVNVYSEFRRADGKVVWMHDDQWEGQRWNISPGAGGSCGPAKSSNGWRTVVGPTSRNTWRTPSSVASNVVFASNTRS